MIHSQTASLQPYPGLRPFKREELHLFFGRKDCLNEMVETIIGEDRFLAVLGASGSGKSSLVRTGFFSALFAGYAGEAGTRWQVADIAHPGETTPFDQLAESLIHASGGGFDPDQPKTKLDKAEVEMLSAYLQRGPASLLEWVKSGNIEPNSNLLILVDQFEELFRYKRDAGGEGEFDRNHIERFVNLLLHSTRSRDANIYVVMTMRAEFLNVCTTVPGLAERLSKNMVVPPRMSRKECELAIRGPQRVLEGLNSPNRFTLDDDLVEDILNDMEALAPWERNEAEVDQVERLARRADQLPLMQHALNRLWHNARKNRRNENDEIRLTRKAYRKMGRLTGALDEHGDQIMTRWSGAQIAVAGRVFRALVDGSSVDKAVRRQRTLSQIVEETEAAPEDVGFVVDAFRGTEINFLTPFGDRRLDEHTKIDISHESLIRQWSTFRRWFQTEAASGRTWTELKRKRDDDEERRKKDERERLLDSLALSDVARWWSDDQPNPKWAERYGGGYAEVSDYLDRSRRRLARRRFRSRVGAGVAALSIAMLSLAGVVANASWRADAEAAEKDAKTAQATADGRRAQARIARLRASHAQMRAAEAEVSAAQAEVSAREQHRIAEEAIRTAARMRATALAAQGRAEESEGNARDAKVLADKAKTDALELLEGHATRIAAGALRTPDGVGSLRALQRQFVSLLDSNDPRANKATAMVESAVGEIGWANFDPKVTRQAADGLGKLTSAPSIDGPEMRARSAVWQARTALLEGRGREAAAFVTDSAIGGASEASRREALLWAAEALFAAGDRPGAARAAKQCHDIPRPAEDIPRPAEGVASDQVNQVKRVIAQCDAMLGRVIEPREEAERLFEDAIRTLKALPESRQDPLTVRALVRALLYEGDRMIEEPDPTSYRPLQVFNDASGLMQSYLSTFRSDRNPSVLLGTRPDRSGAPPLSRDSSATFAFDRYLYAESAIKFLSAFESAPAPNPSLFEAVAFYLDGLGRAIPDSIEPTGGPGPRAAERQLFRIYREFPRVLQRFGQRYGNVNYSGFALLFSRLLGGATQADEFVARYPGEFDAKAVAALRSDSSYVVDLLKQTGFIASFLTYPNIVKADPAKMPQAIQSFCKAHQLIAVGDGDRCLASSHALEAGFTWPARFAAMIAKGPSSTGQQAGNARPANPVDGISYDDNKVALSGIDPVTCAGKLAQSKAAPQSSAPAAGISTLGTLLSDSPCGRDMTGKPEFWDDWGGLFWLFSTQANLEKFRNNRMAYVPALREEVTTVTDD